MSRVISSLLFASSVIAQITTSAFFVGSLNTDKIGYYGSVISANASHTALALTYDNQTTPNLRWLAYDSNFTVTVGPTVFGYSTDIRLAASTVRTDANAQVVNCVRTTSTADVSCTISYGVNVASNLACQSRRTQSSATVFTYILPYSGRSTYPPGTATIEQSFLLTPNTQPIATWCAGRSIPANFSGSVVSNVVPTSSIYTNQIIITAGLEKLNITSTPQTTQPPTTQQTGTGGSGAAVTSSTGTGGAMPIMTMAPAVLGLGAAVAAFVL